MYSISQTVKIRKISKGDTYMKRILIVCLTLFLFLTSCQKKEEQKAQAPFPKGPVIVDNEIFRFQELVRKDPKNVEAWIHLGNTMMDTSRFPEAIDAYQKALDLNDKNVDVRVDMGTCYRRAGNPDKAVEEYRKAIVIDPNHLNAHRNLGVVLAFDLNKKSEAIKEFGEYLKLAPNAPDAPKVRDLVEKLKQTR